MCIFFTARGTNDHLHLMILLAVISYMIWVECSLKGQLYLMMLSFRLVIALVWFMVRLIAIAVWVMLDWQRVFINSGLFKNFQEMILCVLCNHFQILIRLQDIANTLKKNN